MIDFCWIPALSLHPYRIVNRRAVVLPLLPSILTRFQLEANLDHPCRVDGTSTRDRSRQGAAA